MTKAAADQIYLTDADIVFLDIDYLRRLVALAGGLSVARPPMLRLVQADVPRFNAHAQTEGVRSVIGKLVRHSRYIATYGSEPPELKVSRPRGRVTTTDMTSYTKLKGDPSLRQYAPVIWHETVHMGGILAHRKALEAVGFYSGVYDTWGHEDTDLQWKLGEKFGMTMIPENFGTGVLHLDHDKSYFSVSAFERNRRVFEDRKTQGVDEAIRQDIASLLDG